MIGEDFFPVSVWYSGGTARAPMLSEITEASEARWRADLQQINLTRFNLFFPEKRPFFLENAGYFSMGQPRSVELFFSRRIGIFPVQNGSCVQHLPIRGAVRAGAYARVDIFQP